MLDSFFAAMYGFAGVCFVAAAAFAWSMYRDKQLAKYRHENRYEALSAMPVKGDYLFSLDYGVCLAVSDAEIGVVKWQGKEPKPFLIAPSEVVNVSVTEFGKTRLTLSTTLGTWMLEVSDRAQAEAWAQRIRSIGAQAFASSGKIPLP